MHQHHCQLVDMADLTCNTFKNKNLTEKSESPRFVSGRIQKIFKHHLDHPLYAERYCLQRNQNSWPSLEASALTASPSVPGW